MSIGRHAGLKQNTRRARKPRHQAIRHSSGFLQVTSLQGEIQLDSEVGRGSMFSVILPLRLDPGRAEEIRLESAFRASLAGRPGGGEGE